MTGVLLRTAGHAERRAGTLRATATALEPPAGLHQRLHAFFPEAIWKRGVLALSECWADAALPPECSQVSTMFSELALSLEMREKARCPSVSAWHVRLYAERNGRTPRTTPLYEVMLLFAHKLGPTNRILAGRSIAYALILCPGRCGKDVDN